MLKQLIINELAYMLGHNPSVSELKSAFDYVREAWDIKLDLSAFGCLLLDWRADSCIKCTGCDEYFLTEEMTKTDYGWVCNSQICEKELSDRHVLNDEHRIGTFESLGIR